jgi:hypothetical protein
MKDALAPTKAAVSASKAAFANFNTSMDLQARSKDVAAAVAATKEQTTYAVDNAIAARDAKFEQSVDAYNASVEGPTGGPSEGLARERRQREVQAVSRMVMAELEPFKRVVLEH